MRCPGTSCGKPLYELLDPRLEWREALVRAVKIGQKWRSNIHSNKKHKYSNAYIRMSIFTH